MVIETLNLNVMDKDKECQQLVNKLTVMKQMIIDNENELSQQKTFGAVRIGTLTKTACTVSHAFHENKLCFSWAIFNWQIRCHTSTSYILISKTRKSQLTARTLSHWCSILRLNSRLITSFPILIYLAGSRQTLPRKEGSRSMNVPRLNSCHELGRTLGEKWFREPSSPIYSNNQICSVHQPRWWRAPSPGSDEATNFRKLL